jgi:hypothetical protein
MKELLLFSSDLKQNLECLRKEGALSLTDWTAVYQQTCGFKIDFTRHFGEEQL